MPYSIVLQADAVADLEALWLNPRTAEAAARIEALLEDIETDQDALDALTAHDFGRDRRSARMHVSKWVEFWKKGADIWRVKLWELERLRLPFRIVYAYEPPRQRYHILAIVHRNFDYDPAHPISRRIMAVYRDITGG